MKSSTFFWPWVQNIVSKTCFQAIGNQKLWFSLLKTKIFSKISHQHHFRPPIQTSWNHNMMWSSLAQVCFIFWKILTRNNAGKLKNQRSLYYGFSIFYAWHNFPNNFVPNHPKMIIINVFAEDCKFFALSIKSTNRAQRSGCCRVFGKSRIFGLRLWTKTCDRRCSCDWRNYSWFQILPGILCPQFAAAIHYFGFETEGKVPAPTYVCNWNIIYEFLQDFGLKFHIREPYSSYTPIKESLWKDFPAKSLYLSSQAKLNEEQISKFSHKDAIAYSHYEHQMGRFVNAIVPLLGKHQKKPKKKKHFLIHKVSLENLFQILVPHHWIETYYEIWNLYIPFGNLSKPWV